MSIDLSAVPSVDICSTLSASRIVHVVSLLMSINVCPSSFGSGSICPSLSGSICLLPSFIGSMIVCPSLLFSKSVRLSFSFVISIFSSLSNSVSIPSPLSWFLRISGSTVFIVWGVESVKLLLFKSLLSSSRDTPLSWGEIGLTPMLMIPISLHPASSAIFLSLFAGSVEFSGHVCSVSSSELEYISAIAER